MITIGVACSNATTPGVPRFTIMDAAHVRCNVCMVVSRLIVLKTNTEIGQYTVLSSL